MVQRLEELPILPGGLEDGTSFESLEHIEMPITGVNSPVQDEDRMTLTYIETSERTMTPKDDTHSYPATGLHAATLSPTWGLDNGVVNSSETVNAPSLHEADTGRPNSLIDNFCDMVDFHNISDWDLDFLALYPPQIG